MPKAVIIALLFVVVAMTSALRSIAEAAAPESSVTSSEKVIIIVPDKFPHELLPPVHQKHVVAALLRGPGEPDAIVLNPDDVSASGLASAVDGLRRSRSSVTTPERRIAGVVTMADRPREAGRPLEAMEAVLHRVRKESKSEIGNIGQGRWLEVAAPALGLN